MSFSDSKQIGFWSLISLVVGAELGASIFLLPSQLAQFRTFGLIGWLIAGLGAVLLTVVFSLLCAKTAKTGGPHIYAKMFFGEKIGFFVTWIYWCGAWACNPILIATAVNYLISLTGDISLSTKLILEILIVISLTLINTKGVKTSGHIEIVLTALKIVPLIIIPILAIKHINLDNFQQLCPANMTCSDTIIKATILSFWGFVGLEGGTSPAGVVKNAKRTIPLAITLGTAFVAIISFINTFVVYGIINPTELENIGAPFAKIMVVIFGSSFEKTFGLLTFLMCYGSLNAWVMFSGQIARTASHEKMLPKFLGKLNRQGAPGNSLWVSALGTVIILILQKTSIFGDKVGKFLDMSVVIYIALYTIAVLAYIKFMKNSKIKSLVQIIIVALSLFFCGLLIFKSDLLSFSALAIMIVSGIPVYRKMKKNETLPI